MKLHSPDRRHRQIFGQITLAGLLAGLALPVAGQETPSNPSPSQPPIVLTEQARAIHAAGMLIDGHNDLPWAVRGQGGSFTKTDIRQPQPGFHTDIPRLREGGVKAQFWSVWVPANTDLTGNALLQTLEQIDLVHDMIQRYPDVFEMASTADDIERIARQGRIASMIGVEGGYAVQESIPVIRRLYERGARYMTLTHSRTLAWADSATDEPRHGGLTRFGEEVVREMNRVGMIVDLSHVSPDTMDDALDVTAAPVIFSHSSARAVCDHPRNVPDEILKRLPDNGGIVMVNFYSGFIVPTRDGSAPSDRRGHLRDVADHIDHLVNMAGVDHVGIGSDFDGVDRLPVQLEHVGQYPYLTQELLNRGYNGEQIHKILGGNVLRVIRQVEQSAQRLRDQNSP